MAAILVTDQTGTKIWRNPRQWARELREGIGPYGLLPLAVLFGLNMVDEFDRVAFGALAPEIRDSFGLENDTFLAIVAVSSILPILLSVPIGVMADRRHRVRMSQWAGLVWAVSALAIGFLPSLGILIAARFIGGVGKLVNEPVHPNLLADYYPERELPRVLGIHRFANTAGLIVGPVAGFMGLAWGYRTTFVVMTIPTLILLAVSLRLKEPARGGAGGSLLTGPADAEKIKWTNRFRMLWSQRALRRTWFGAFFFGSGIAPVSAILAIFFEEVFQLDARARGTITALSGIFAAVGLAWGTRLTQKAVFSGRADKLPVAVALLIMSFAVGTILMVLSPWVLLAITFASLASVGITGFFPPYLVLVTFAVPPRLRSQAFSYSLLFFAFGALIFAPTSGGIGDRYGYRLSTGLLSVLVAIGGSFGFSVRKVIVGDIERAGSLIENWYAARSSALADTVAVAGPPTDAAIDKPPTEVRVPLGEMAAPSVAFDPDELDRK